MTAQHRHAARWLLLSALFFSPHLARAGSIFATDRGVRPMGRAGAFVAGADDGQSVWMNPAGLSDAGNSLSIDAAVVISPLDFHRQTETTDADGVRRIAEFQKVSGSTPPIPIPGVVYTRVLSPSWTGALSVIVPYGPPRTFPATVGGAPAPQRYSDISQEGSALGIFGAHAAYKVSESFRVGGGVQLMLGTLKDRKILQAALPDRLIGAPESPLFDADVTLRLLPIISPSANLGAIWIPNPHLRVGGSLQAPFYIYAPGTMSVNLPESAILRGATQNGTTAVVSAWLPPSVRLGVEYRSQVSGPGLRVEAAWVREFGSFFDEMHVKSNGASIDNLPALPSPLPIPDITVHNHTRDFDSFRLGAEYIHGEGQGSWQLRGGVQHNGAGVETKYATVRTYGPEHVLLTVGVGYQLSAKVTVDAMYAKALDYNLTVSPQEAAVPADLIFQGNPTSREAQNGGKYESSLDVVGLGIRYAL